MAEELAGKGLGKSIKVDSNAIYSTYSVSTIHQIHNRPFVVVDERLSLWSLWANVARQTGWDWGSDPEATYLDIEPPTFLFHTWRRAPPCLVPPSTGNDWASNNHAVTGGHCAASPSDTAASARARLEPVVAEKKQAAVEAAVAAWRQKLFTGGAIDQRGTEEASGNGSRGNTSAKEAVTDLTERMAHDLSFEESRPASAGALECIEIQVDGWTVLKAIKVEEEQEEHENLDVEYILFPEDPIDKAIRLL